MAIFNQQSSAKKDVPSFANDAAPNPQAAPTPIRETPAAADFNPTQAAPPRAAVEAPAKESLIAADLTIEGKIEGAGHVRIAGRFKGDVHVDGNLTLEAGAVLTGQVHADVVIVSGELHGNIQNAKRVELLEGGVIAGDVKAGSLTVAAGSRMRGQVEFGWDERSTKAEKGFGNAS